MKSFLSIACHVYAVSAALYLFFLIRPWKRATDLGLLALAAGFLLHGVVIAHAFASTGVSPVSSLADGLSFLAWLLAFGYLVVDRLYKLPVIGAFVTPLIVAVLLPALLMHGEARALSPALKATGLPVHIAIAFAGMASFAIAAGVAVMYLLLERELKGKRFGVLFSRLPSLEVLDDLNNRLVRWGFIALSITLISGAFFAKQAWGDYWRWEPKQTLSLVGWLVYAALIHARMFVGWRGKRVAVLTMVGFGILFSSYVGLGLFPMGQHGGDFQ